MPLLLLVAGAWAWAEEPIQLEAHSSSRYGKTVPERIERLSRLFLGKRYLVDPLGEGEQGAFDRDPLYRCDAFDCTTYVETVLALSGSESKAGFEKFLLRLRYRGEQPRFQERNHFPDADWRPHLIQLGVVCDITDEIAGRTLPRAKSRIDKRRWFAALQPERIRVPAASASEIQELLAKARKEGESLKPVEVQIPYLPFQDLFERKPNGYLARTEVLDRIPSGAIFNVVRTRYTPSDKVGTELSIWHQGFLIRKNGALWVRHATHLGAGRVTEVPAVDFFLAEYLRKVNVGSKDHGLNLLGVLAPASKMPEAASFSR